MVILRTERTEKKTAKTTREAHYYLSSVLPEQLPGPGALALIRGHWGGVEIRNHWRRDALMGEDRSRSRHPKLLANVALLRNVLLAVLADKLPHLSLPEVFEYFATKPARLLHFVQS